MTARLAMRLRPLLLVAAVMVIGHDLALAIGHGPAAQLSASLRATEHGLGWLLPATAVLMTVVAAVGVTAWQILRLRRRLRRLGAPAPPAAGGYRAEMRRLWPRLFALGLGGFVVQENIEHLGHGHLVGLAPLIEGQYALSVPVFAVVSLLVAAVGAALRIRLEELGAAVVAARRRLPRPFTRLSLPPRPPLDLRTVARRASQPILGRAPPACSL